MNSHCFPLFFLAIFPITLSASEIEVVDLRPRISEREVTLTLLLFSASDYEFKVVDNGPDRDNPKFDELKTAALETNLVAVINGGFFDVGKFTPLGAVVSDGKKSGVFETDSWMRGIFASRDGRPFLLPLSDQIEPRNYDQFLQSGDWLVTNGLSTSHPEEPRPRRRSFIGHDASGRWVFGCCDSATMQELAILLKREDVASVIDLEMVLNLDGGPSSGLVFVKGKTVVAHVRERWNVRNFIGIVPK